MPRTPLHMNRPAVLAAWALSMGAVAWLSLAPGAGYPPLFAHADKLGHFASYAWLALLPMRGFGTRRVAISGAGAMIFLGAALEVAQAFVPMREPSIMDMAANTLGVIAGINLGNRLKRRDAMRQSGLDKWYNADGSRKDLSK